MQRGAAAELLARAPVFHGLSGELLGVILRSSTVAQLRAGEEITRAGVPADAALFILEGTAQLQDASGRDLETVVGPGTGLCDMAMVIDTGPVHGAVARSDVTLLALPRIAMAQLMVAQPTLAAQIAGNIRKNLAATAERLHELDVLLANPVAGPDFDDLARRDETDRPANGFSEARIDAFQDTDRSAANFNGAANGGSANGGAANGARENGGVNGFGPGDAGPPLPDFLRPPAPAASQFDALVNHSGSAQRPRVPVHNLLAELSGANGAAN